MYVCTYLRGCSRPTASVLPDGCYSLPALPQRGVLSEAWVPSRVFSRGSNRNICRKDAAPITIRTGATALDESTRTTARLHHREADTWDRMPTPQFVVENRFLRPLLAIGLESV